MTFKPMAAQAKDDDVRTRLDFGVLITNADTGRDAAADVHTFLEGRSSRIFARNLPAARCSSRTSSSPCSDDHLAIEGERLVPSRHPALALLREWRYTDSSCENMAGLDCRHSGL